MNKRSKILFVSDGQAVKNLSENINYFCGCIESRLITKISKREDSSLIKEMICKEIEYYHPDFLFIDGLCFSYSNKNEIVTVLSEIKEHYKIKIIYWAKEDPLFTTLTDCFAVISDLIFTVEEDFIGRYNVIGSVGKECYFLPFAANSLRHYPTNIEEKYRYDVIFIGNNYGYERRRKVVSELFLGLSNCLDINFKVFGTGWIKGTNPYIDDSKLIEVTPPIYRGAIPYDEISYLYSSSNISIGVSNCPESKTHLPSRIYEALACGSLHLMQDCPAVNNVFGNIVETYKDKIELIEKIRYYKSRQKEKKINIERCLEFVNSNHTYKQRALFVQKVLMKGVG